MRITKKYTGASCLGKRAYNPDVTKASTETLHAVQAQLNELEMKFRKKLDDKYLHEHQIIYSELKGSGGVASLPYPGQYFPPAHPHSHSHALPSLYGSSPPGGGMMYYEGASAAKGLQVSFPQANGDVPPFYPIHLPMSMPSNMTMNPGAFMDPSMAAAAAAAFDYSHSAAGRSPFVLVPREYFMATDQRQQHGGAFAMRTSGHQEQSFLDTQVIARSSGDISSGTTSEEGERTVDSRSESCSSRDLKEEVRKDASPRDSKNGGISVSVSSLTTGSDDTYTISSGSGSELGIDEKAEPCNSPSRASQASGNRSRAKKSLGEKKDRTLTENSNSSSSSQHSTYSRYMNRKENKKATSTMRASEGGNAGSPSVAFKDLQRSRGKIETRDHSDHSDAVACLLGLSTSTSLTSSPPKKEAGIRQDGDIAGYDIDGQTAQQSGCHRDGHQSKRARLSDDVSMPSSRSSHGAFPAEPVPVSMPVPVPVPVPVQGMASAVGVAAQLM
jgi:hypothetical protein